MHAMLLRFASCIPVLILKNQRHNLSQTNDFSQIIKFDVPSDLIGLLAGQILRPNPSRSCLSMYICMHVHVYADCNLVMHVMAP